MGKLLRQRADELTLYARHLAWLHATPRPPEGSKRAAKSPAKGVSRFDRFRAQTRSDPPMPTCAEPHVIARWIEVGMVQGGGMAPTALLWSEIAAFRDATGLPLDTWQARMIRAMSVAYIAEGRRAEDESCPPPWHSPVTKMERDTEEARLRMVLG